MVPRRAGPRALRTRHRRPARGPSAGRRPGGGSWLPAELDSQSELLRIPVTEIRRRPDLNTEAADQLIAYTFQSFAEWLRRAAGPGLTEERAQTIATLALGSLLSSRLLRNVVGVEALGVDDDITVRAWVEMVVAMLTLDQAWPCDQLDSLEVPSTPVVVAQLPPSIGVYCELVATRPRRARLDDVHQLAMAMPHVIVERGSGGNPIYQVGGKSFIFFRNPRPDATDPVTGERYDDVIVFWVPSESDKEALVQDSTSPFFTTPHFKGHSSVLLRASRIRELTRQELMEMVQDAWLARASPKRAASWQRSQEAT